MLTLFIAVAFAEDAGRESCAQWGCQELVVDARAAFRADRKACDAGEAAACLGAARAYRAGSGTVQDASRAVTLYQGSCEGGVGAACRELGEMYALGTGVMPDPSRAFGWYDRACGLGDAPGCFLVAQHHARGWAGVAPDAERAGALYLQACEGGEARACTALSRGARRDDARRWLTLGCDGGDGEACTGLARMSRDVELYDRACALGDGVGCRHWAEALERHDAPDAAVRKAWSAGCDAGDSAACRQARK